MKRKLLVFCFPFAVQYKKQQKENVHMKKDKKDQKPEWLKKAAKSMLQGQKESYGDEDQNETMELIESNDDDQL